MEVYFCENYCLGLLTCATEGLNLYKTLFRKLTVYWNFIKKILIHFGSRGSWQLFVYSQECELHRYSHTKLHFGSRKVNLCNRICGELICVWLAWTLKTLYVIRSVILLLSSKFDQILFFSCDECVYLIAWCHWFADALKNVNTLVDVVTRKASRRQNTLPKVSTFCGSEF